MAFAKVGRRGQITLPREIRERLGLKEGDKVAFVGRNGDVVMVPLTAGIRALRGSVKGPHIEDYDEVRRRAIEEHVRRQVANDE